MSNKKLTVKKVILEYWKSSVLFFLILGIICTVFVYFTPIILRLISDTKGSSSEIGDAIGGITTPIIGIITAWLMFMAFYVQYRYNEESFAELKKSQVTRDEEFKAKLLHNQQLQERNFKNTKQLQKERIEHEKKLNNQVYQRGVFDLHLKELKDIEKNLQELTVYALKGNPRPLYNHNYSSGDLAQFYGHEAIERIFSNAAEPNNFSNQCIRERYVTRIGIKSLKANMKSLNNLIIVFINKGFAIEKKKIVVRNMDIIFDTYLDIINDLYRNNKDILEVSMSDYQKLALEIKKNHKQLENKIALLEEES